MSPFFLILLDVFLSLGGCVVSATHPAGGSMFWTGLVMIIFGWVISHLANTKECPTCRETVKHAALKCEHCGSDFGGELNPAQRRV